MEADGSHDIHRQLDLSGEPLVPPLRAIFQLRDPLPLLKYQDLTVEGKAFSAAYYDHWNSTSSDEGGSCLTWNNLNAYYSPRTNCRRGDNASGPSRSRDTWKVLPHW